MTATLNTRKPRIVLFEGSGSLPLEAETRWTLLRGLLEDGHAVTRTGRDGEVRPEDGSDHLVLGRFRDRAPTDRPGLAFVDLEGREPEAIREELRERLGTAAKPWKPWFPVIDHSRCTNCLQCLTFCLFDVYGVDSSQKIEVQHQTHCKTDCPACSRVCPEAAIMFPKYGKGPINGDEVRESDVRREAMKVDVSALLGGDLYAALRTRSSGARERFSTERDESKALLERKRCLAKLGKALDIPDEVLMTLPSAGDIEERTRRAQEKAARRAERSQTEHDRRSATPKDWDL